MCLPAITSVDNLSNSFIFTEQRHLIFPMWQQTIAHLKYELAKNGSPSVKLSQSMYRYIWQGSGSPPSWYIEPTKPLENTHSKPTATKNSLLNWKTENLTCHNMKYSSLIHSILTSHLSLQSLCYSKSEANKTFLINAAKQFNFK